LVRLVGGLQSKTLIRLGNSFGSRNTEQAYDPANIGLTAIPKFERYTINQAFLFSAVETAASIG